MVSYGLDDATRATKAQTLESFFDAMQYGTRHCPRAVEMLMDAKDIGMEEVGSEIIVKIVPTLIRSVASDEYETYEYKIEGWILGDYGPDRIWVGGDLYTNDAKPGVICEVHVGVIPKEEALSTPKNSSS